MNALALFESKKLMLGSGNRESLDIINLILLVCVTGTMKTHIMYKCNLNSKQVQEYLEMILRFELVQKVETESGRTTYLTTEKGRKLTKAYASMLEIFGLHGEDSLKV